MFGENAFHPSNCSFGSCDFWCRCVWLIRMVIRRVHWAPDILLAMLIVQSHIAIDLLKVKPGMHWTGHLLGDGSQIFPNGARSQYSLQMRRSESYLRAAMVLHSISMCMVFALVVSSHLLVVCCNFVLAMPRFRFERNVDKQVPTTPHNI